MATLIPSIGSCVSRMTSGERKLAERLEQKLDDDYLLWYDVPVGPKQSHPDFVVIHPRRGLLVLETKDWKLDTIKSATRQAWEIIPGGQVKVVINPLAQARHCAIQVVNALERDPQLVQASGAHLGKLAFPWSYGVVFTRITRKQFDAAGLGEAIEPHYVICQDEMLETADPEAFQQRLWNMFPHSFGEVMSLPQLDRVRWIMFPQVRVQTQGALFDDSDAEAELPSIMRVMDLQQEQLARSLGDGHRVIHGVAGSGKTMTFPLPEIVATLSRQLSWSHFVNLLPLKTEPARQFYASQAASNTWRVRELRHQIERKAFERTELAALQAPAPVRGEHVETAHTNPALVFKDPYFLDFLGLRQGHDEADLEAAILRQLEAFILELGRGFLSHASQTQQRYIEVKSVGKLPGGQGHRFFLSENEHTVSKSADHRGTYFFYLVFFNGNGQPFELQPIRADELYELGEMSPASYVVRFDF